MRVQIVLSVLVHGLLTIGLKFPLRMGVRGRWAKGTYGRMGSITNYVTIIGRV